MRLTLVNLIKRKKPIGYQYHGKYHIVKPVKLEALWKRHDEYELEERNMFLLRHPYLTVEQSRAYNKYVKLNTIRDTSAGWPDNLRKNEKFERRYTWAEQLSHLGVKDAWE